MNKNHFLFRGFLTYFLFFYLIINAQNVKSWQTSASGSLRLQQQTDVAFLPGNGTSSTKITINPTQQYQSMVGFGWAMTQGSAYTISMLSDADQNTLLNDLYNVETGLGSAVMRVGVGASDLGQGVYSYQDNQNIAFSLAGPDLTYLVPVLQKVVQINPNIKILGSPWSAPAWMKTNNNAKGGSLKPACYDLYADYLINYIRAMHDQGIPIWGLTIQNEPENAGNTPSMLMTKEEQVAFVNNSLGPKLAASEFSTVKLIGFDHNCDNPGYATYVCNNCQYIDGAAFHLYAGSIDALSQTHNATTNKNIYFTEQWTGSGSWSSGDYTSHTRDIMIGAPANWAKTCLEWNVSSDQNYDPHTDNGGCDRCMGAVTVNSTTKTYTKNIAYYHVAQMSKVTRYGCIRIGSTFTNANGLIGVAFQNPDQSTALVVFNTSGSAVTFDIIWNGQVAKYTLPGNTTGSFAWAPLTITQHVTGVSIAPVSVEVPVWTTTQLTATVLPSDATQKSVLWTSGDANTATVDATGLVTGIKAGTVNITATTLDMSKTSVCNVTVKDNGTGSGQFPDIYNIYPVNSGKGLQVVGKSTAAGASIQQFTTGTGDDQRWLIIPAGVNIYYFKSKLSGMYLTAMGTSNGATITQQVLIGNSQTQQWQIASISNNVYTITNVGGIGMDVDGPSTNDGQLLHLWTYNGTTNQQFSFTKVENGTTSVTQHVENINYEVYPNPVQAQLFVKFDSQKERVVSLYSLSGEMLLTQRVTKTSTIIDVADIKDGLYIMQIEDGNNISHTKILKRSNL